MRKSQARGMAVVGGISGYNLPRRQFGQGSIKIKDVLTEVFEPPVSQLGIYSTKTLARVCRGASKRKSPAPMFSNSF